MKKFLSIFCVLTILSSSGVYAQSGNVKKDAFDIYLRNGYIKYINSHKNVSNKPCVPVETTTSAAVEKPTETTTSAVVEKPTETTTSAAVEKPTETTTQSQTSNNPSVNKSIEQQVLDLVNKERTSNGLSPLTLNAEVSKVAQMKSEDMRDKNYFSHTSPTYGSPFDMLKKFNVKYTYAGENIAKGQKTPEAVVNAWMNSEGHRANILNPNYTQMGIGYALKGSTPYWTQMFIKQ